MTALRPFAALGALGIALSLSAPARALVTTPVGGGAGDVDVNVRATFERGKVEPNDNEASWQEASWEIYTLGAGYTVGDAGPLFDLFFRVEYNFYDAPAEVVDVDQADCLGRVLSPTSCEIHGSDRGHLVTPQIGFNVVHEPAFTLGFFLMGNVPIGVDFEKFVLPRTDSIGGGTAVGVRFTPWLTYESRTFFGSGPFNGEQNATVALINNFGFEASRWLLPWKIGVRVGPYFDADLTERFDPVYDAAFVSGVPTTADGTVSSPADTRDRIRSMRFGVSIGPYVQVTEYAALEANYTQKLFGYDTPATRFFSVGARAAF